MPVTVGRIQCAISGFEPLDDTKDCAIAGMGDLEVIHVPDDSNLVSINCLVAQAQAT